MVGVGGDELTAVGPDLAVVPSFIIAGPPRSGRSTALLTMVASLLAAGTPVVLAAPRRSPLRRLAGLPGVLDVVTDEAFTSRRLAELTAELDGPYAVALDDAESLLKCDAGSDLGDIARTGAESGRALLIAGSIDGLGGGFGGWHVDARRNRQGLLLQPQGLGDGELIGVKVSRTHLGAGRAGRALLHLGDGALRAVQVPETGPDAVAAALGVPVPDAPAPAGAPARTS
jgi:S-DNA-T family DNA segregation ATPase FtsK/SpoIIIE